MVAASDESLDNSTLRFDYRYTSVSMMLTNSSNDSLILNLEPDNPHSTGIQYTIYGFTLGLVTDSVFGNDSILKDIYFSWFGQRFGAELFYQNYTNFYIAEDDTSEKNSPVPLTSILTFVLIIPVFPCIISHGKTITAA